MNFLLHGALGGAVLALSTAAASAGPIVLDTEQKAAAGVATALSKSELPRAVNGAIDSVREYADLTLKAVHAATTPAALLATRGGITINCSISGSLHAKMVDTHPRVLRVQWQECVRRQFGFERTFDGPVAITLPADTLQPQNVLAIRLGNASGEFQHRFRSESPSQINHTTEAFNIVQRGEVSMTRLGDCCEWVGSSSFRMNGYRDLRNNFEAPPGAPLAFVSHKITAEGLHVIRSTNTADGVDEDDALYEGGSLSITNDQPPPFGIWTDAFRFNDYHVRRITDFNAGTDQVSVDGRINVTWSRFAGAGCMDGLYAFKTRAPLINPFGTLLYESGEIVVNNSVVASFYSPANAPPTLPTPVNGMLLSTRVRNVATFNYDVASVWDALTPVGQCPP
jgi:hypothetical protein